MDTSKLYRYWGIAALLIWAAFAIGLNLLRFDPYGIDEAAARALLLSWTVADRVVNPIVTLGAPDFRALLFLPLGAYWSGSFIALKVFMLLMLFAAVTLMYRWSRQHQDGETAMLASGLLLIAPIALMQINAVGSGPFLLLGFAVATWLDQRYRKVGKQLGGWFFVQLLLITTLVTIHPAGLAYPLALAWEWRNNPLNDRQTTQMNVGIPIAAVIGLMFGYLFGNATTAWGSNPLAILGAADLGRIPGDPSFMEPGAGIIAAAIVGLVVFGYRKQLLKQFLPRILFLGSLLGLAAADYGWALVVLAFVLYCGLPLLIKINEGFGANSFGGKRGIVMIVVFIVATLFMINDRNYRSSVINNTIEPHDEIIKTLVIETEGIEENFYTVSQWPARTMLALKRPVFPLPPNYDNTEELLKNLGQIDYIIFDPFDPTNKQLRDNLSNLSSNTETLVQTQSGVIVKLLKTKAQKTVPSPIL